MLTFPAPSAKVLALTEARRWVAAVTQYQEEATVTLLNGVPVRLCRGGCFRVVKAIRLGLPVASVAVEEGFYEPAGLMEARRADPFLKA